MGVYDEIVKKCPNCRDGYLYTQTKAMDDPGMRTFWVDNPEQLAEQLSVHELHRLRGLLSTEKIWCHKSTNCGYNEDGCGYGTVLFGSEAEDDRLRVANELFGSPDQERDE